MYSDSILKCLLDNGFSLYTGVPCSMLNPLLTDIVKEDGDRLQYIAATDEGQALGISAGGVLAGRRAVVLSQNSGLGNMINPLTSLVKLYKIPVLIILSLRGKNKDDGEEHLFMYKITRSLLNSLKIKWCLLPQNIDALRKTMKRVTNYMDKFYLPYALLLKGGMVASSVKPDNSRMRIYSTPSFSSPDFARFYLNKNKIMIPTKIIIKEILSSVEEEDIIISTTGKISRELYALKPHCNTFYMIGSMGYASSIGLGIALSRPRKRVIVIDGDGALLMKMGSLATIGYYSPKNLVHIVIDNGMYESTGGQICVSRGVNLAAVASECGYDEVYSVAALKEIRLLLRRARLKMHLTFLSIPACQSKSTVGRVGISAYQIKENFVKHI